MRLVIHEQLDITDEQRVRMADVIDGKITKRQATRDEMKEWIWDKGGDWEFALENQWTDLFGPAEDLVGENPNAELELEDLL